MRQVAAAWLRAVAARARALLACFALLSALAGCAPGYQAPGAGGVEMPAGPIWDNADAQRKCPNVCGGQGWNGAWRTTVPGTESVCSCGGFGSAATGMVPMGRPTSCRAAGNDVCAGCSISCPPGKLATCTEGEVHQASGFSPYCWTKSRCECQ